MTVKPIPDGYHSVTPYLMVADAAGLLEFLRDAFGAVEAEKMAGPDGKIMHAEVKIGDSHVMLSEAQGQWQPMPCAIYLYVTDADATYAQALAAGATSVMEPMDQFYGDRHGGVKDRFGNLWWIATRIEDVSKEELARRAQEWMAKRKS
jgi:PhnB protein